MSSKSLLCNIRTHWVNVNMLEWKVCGMKNLKLLFIRNKRKLHLSFQRMQPLARSVKTFKLNPHYGVFQQLHFFKFQWNFSDTATEKNHFNPKIRGLGNIHQECRLEQIREDLHCNKMEKILTEKYQILQVLFLNFPINQFLVRIFLNRFEKVF